MSGDDVCRPPFIESLRERERKDGRCNMVTDCAQKAGEH